MNILSFLSISIMISSSLYPAFALDTLQTCDTRILSPHNGHWPSSHIYIEDTNGSMPYTPLTDHTAIFHDDDVWNTSAQPGTVNVTLTIQNQDTGQQVFNQTQSLQMQACSGPESVKWRFVPIQVANYIATVSDNRGNVSMSFNSILDTTKSQTVSLPLEQLRFGVNSHNVICRQDLQLVIKSEDNSPACVKPDTAKMLIERGWATNTSQVNPMADLKDDNGTVTLGNQTYYFETPNYTHATYSNPVQISFHDVIFTLFPSGFRGGLPIPCSQQGSHQYYWTDAKFRDYTHELLHILVDSPPCTNTIPIMFSNHTNPQAGLTFYDDKMKLLVSTNANSTVLQTMPKLTYMNIKVFSSYTPSSLADHFLSGSLNSTEGPIQNGNVTITVNGIVMGTTGTYPSGCFQFNDWNDSKLADQINKSISLGDSSTELNFQAQYFGDSNHNPANASAISYLSLYAVPLAPAQYDTGVYPSDQINVTQGGSTQFHLTVKAFSKYWEVEHMILNLQRTPCGLSYHISPVDNNDSVLVNNTASFGVILNTTSYTPSGKYWISVDQDLSGINEPNIGANVGAFYLNVLKK